MDLGIRGRRAIVCASSKGLGLGCAQQLAREGVELVMLARKFGRIVNITSASVKHPIESLGMSNGARAGLTGFVAGLARQIISHNVTINNLLPGPFATDRILQTAAARAKDSGQTVEDILKARMAAVPAKRFGTTAEFGQACAFLCGASSGFMTGQNLVLDGGIYPGTL